MSDALSDAARLIKGYPEARTALLARLDRKELLELALSAVRMAAAIPTGPMDVACARCGHLRSQHGPPGPHTDGYRECLGAPHLEEYPVAWTMRRTCACVAFVLPGASPPPMELVSLAGEPAPRDRREEASRRRAVFRTPPE